MTIEDRGECDHAGDLQIGWQTSERMILQTGWKASLGLLKIELLDTMIDDEGENQLRLGVIY